MLLRLLMLGVGAVGVLLAGSALLLWIVLSGGVDQILEGDPPRPDDAEVVEARTATQAWFAIDASRVADDVVAPGLGQEAALLGTGDQAAPCEVGEHDWKVDDDFDLICRLESVRVLAVPSRDGRGAGREAVEAALRADGWRSMWVSDHAGAPGRWTKRVDERLLTLEAAWITPRAKGWELGYQWDPDLALVRGLGQPREQTALRDAQGRVVDPEALVRQVPRSGYAVVLNQSVEYFRE